MQNVIKSLKIRGLSLENNVFLAPLESFTNVALRKSMLKYNKGLQFTEMIPANALSKDRNYCKYFLYRNENEKFLAYQLGGSNSYEFVNAINNIDEKIDMININLGCPVEKVINQNVGCGLLKNEEEIYKSIKSIHNEFDIPLSIKIRTGIKLPKHLDYEKLYENGCDLIIIHGRTCEQKYSQGIDYRYLYEAKDKTSIKIIGNGDLKNIKDIENMYNKTLVDGFMIGRASLNNPKIFEDIHYGNYQKDWANTMNYKEKLDFIIDYKNNLENYNFKAIFIKVKTLTSFIFKYSNNAKEFRSEIMKKKNFDELINYIDKVYIGDNIEYI